MKLKGKKIAILAGKIYEDTELWYPYFRLKEEGATVELVGTSDSPDVVESKHGYPARIDCRANIASADDFHGVVIPGGYSPDHLRRCKQTVDFVRDIFDQGKLVAAICHGGWVLVSANIAKGIRGTSYISIKDDLTNAGMDWSDEEVVVDGNVVTSRYPDDLPAFMRTIIEKLV